MKLERATKKQRIISWLIDAVLVGGIGFVIGFFIVRHLGLSEKINSLYQEYLEAYSNEENGAGIMENILALMAKRIGIYSGIYIILVMLYLVILPYFAPWQTLGRLITKCKLVVLYTGEKPTFGRLLLREVLGEYLLYIVLTLVFLAWNIVFWYSAMKAVMKNVSLPDKFGKLKLVDSRMILKEEEVTFTPEEFEYPEDYDWEKENETPEVLDMNLVNKMREDLDDKEESQVKK